MDPTSKNLTLGEQMEEEADTNALLKEAMDKGTSGSDSTLKPSAPAFTPTVEKGGRKRRRGGKTAKKVKGRKARKTRKH